MNNTYFSVERAGKNIDHVLIRHEDGSVAFEDVMGMSYEELKVYNHIDEFVTCVIDATNKHFNDSDDQTIVTLIGEDDIFIWSVLIGPGDSADELKYAFIDWTKDGKSYRYEK